MTAEAQPRRVKLEPVDIPLRLDPTPFDFEALGRLTFSTVSRNLPSKGLEERFSAPSTTSGELPNWYGRGPEDLRKISDAPLRINKKETESISSLEKALDEILDRLNSNSCREEDILELVNWMAVWNPVRSVLVTEVRPRIDAIAEIASGNASLIEGLRTANRYEMLERALVKGQRSANPRKW